jgi:hypothetical protein
MITIDPNKPIPCALFDLRPLMNPAAWSLLTALIENEYGGEGMTLHAVDRECLTGCPDIGPLSVDTLAEMTGLDRKEASKWLHWMSNNAFIPVESDVPADFIAYVKVNDLKPGDDGVPDFEPMFRLDLNKTAKCFRSIRLPVGMVSE